MSNILYNFTNVQGIITKVSLVLFQTNREVIKQELIYRGEGNANIVISIPEKRQILRIQKTEQPQTFLLWFIDWIVNILNLNNRNRIKNDCQDLSFYRNIMMPLLGEFVCEATPVFVSKKQTSDLSKAITQSRPSFRKHKKLQFGRATFFTDYAFLPKSLESNKLTGSTFAVEIKPKQGWIPIQSRQCSKCQFCQNQYLKLEQGQIKKISDYCPLDLFSGCKKRMSKTLGSLIHNPQNNFKIFRNGIYSYGDNVDVNVFYDLIREWFQYDDNMSTDRLLVEFCNLMYDVLVKRIENQLGSHKCIQLKSYYDVKHNNEQYETATCVYSESTLPYGCVLEKILSIQKFDQLGIESYIKIHEAINRNGISDFTYVDKLLKEVNKSKCAKCVIINHINRSIDYIRGECGSADITELELMPYLIASVVNDCSLMITCRRIRESDQILSEHIRTESGQYVVSVGVFDLYPKPMSTLKKHIRRKTNIQKAYNSSLH